MLGSTVVVLVVVPVACISVVIGLETVAEEVAVVVFSTST
jgi:hypothetical protein